MAIPDSGAPYVYQQLDASTKFLLLEDLKDALVASGWTSATVSAYVVLTFTGLPAGNQTCVFDGVTYKFVAVLNQANAYEVLIGGTATACAANLADAINETAGTKGTAYSTATTAHPTCTAVAVASACTVRATNGLTASEALNNATLDSATFRYGGYKLDSARCPSGLQMRLILDDDLNATNIRIRVATCDESVILTSIWRLATAAERLLEFIGCKYQVFTFLLGAYAQYGCNFMCGTPALETKNVAPTISAIADSGGLFQITTATAHALVTGDHVYIAGATKDTGASASAINGDWQVTVLDSLNYTLDASTYGAESYDANSGLSGTTSAISRAFWVAGDDAAFRNDNFRNTLGYYISLGTNVSGVCLNQYIYSSLTGAPLLRVKLPMEDDGYTLLDVGGMVDLCETRISWPISSAGGARRTVGLLWNAFVLAAPYPMDKVKHNWQGFNWINYTNNAYATKGSLWLITTAVA